MGRGDVSGSSVISCRCPAFVTWFCVWPALPITVIGSNFNIEYEKSEAEARMKRQLELSQLQEGESSSGNQEHGASAANLSTGSHKALLGAVERLLSDQREVILQRADDMIAQHVREIAKEVVTQSRTAAHAPSTSTPESRGAVRHTAAGSSIKSPIPSQATTREGMPEQPASDVPASAAGGSDGRGASQPSGAASAAGALVVSTPDVT